MFFNSIRRERFTAINLFDLSADTAVRAYKGDRRLIDEVSEGILHIVIVSKT